MPLHTQFPMGFWKGLLPLSIDFSTLADGAIPSPLVGATWGVNSGKATDTPTASENQVVNGTFAAWTDNNPDNWSVQNEDASTYVIESGGKAQFVAVEFDLVLSQAVALTTRQWFETQFTGVKTSNFVNYRVLNTTLGTLVQVASSTRLYTGAITANNPTPIFTPASLPTNWTLDDVSLKTFSSTELIAYVISPSAIVNVGAQITLTTVGKFQGVVANLDATFANYVVAVIDGRNNVYLFKCVNGVVSLVTSGSALYVANATLEIRRNGTAYQVWYNGSQVGIDQTISDVTIVDNRRYGLFSTGGGGFSFFFAHAPVITETAIVYLGGSITNGSGASDTAHQWRTIAHNYFLGHWSNTRLTAGVNSATGGVGSFYHLALLQSKVLDYVPDVVFLDCAVNDNQYDALGQRENGFAPASEALIRQIKTELPEVRLVVPIFTYPNGYSGADDLMRTSRDKWLTLASLYDIPLLRWDQYLETLIGTTTPTDEQVEIYLAGHYDVHPSDAGHAAAAALITSTYPNTPPSAQPSVLPTRYYAESQDFEQSPQLVNGVDLMVVNGSWTVVSTAISSSEVGAQVSFTGTFCSFSVERTGNVSYSIDGGGFTTIGPISGTGGVDNFTRGEHTITLKVISGTVQISRLFAI